MSGGGAGKGKTIAGRPATGTNMAEEGHKGGKIGKPGKEREEREGRRGRKQY